MVRGIKIVIVASLIGKNSFHVKYMRLSYRIRGIVARIQINMVAITIVFITRTRSINKIENPVKKIMERRLIIRIFAYSAIKIRANMPLLYSTLNPDTSSDSPSAKSKGVRLVSAKFVMNHIIARGRIINMIHDRRFEEIMDMSIWRFKMRADNKISDILTSYEMVCATPRRAPSRAYLELEHHPAIKVVYTFMLETHRK